MVIFRPARAACQQGKALLNTWKIHPGEQQKWENPLMGWTSTSDPLSNTHMTLEFNSKEDAIKFAQKNAWKYEVVEPDPPNRAIVTPKSYSDNFTWKGAKGRTFPDLYVPPPPPPPPKKD